jgi:hypothetical protein
MFHYNSYPGYRWEIQMSSRDNSNNFVKLQQNNYNNIQIWSKNVQIGVPKYFCAQYLYK